MPKISVITPSVRPEGLKLVEKALKRQTFRDFEFIPQGKTRENKEGEYWTIYSDYNEAIKKSKGELIISWQDHTFAKPDTLERFWNHYQNDKHAIVSAIGNKYQDENFIVQTWQDPRQRSDQGSFYECNFNDIEINLASFPREAFYAVGGFDEFFNAYSSLCGLDVLARLLIIGGWKFYLDQTINSYSTEHGRMANWEENLPFGAGGAWEKKLQEYRINPKLNYLT